MCRFVFWRSRAWFSLSRFGLAVPTMSWIDQYTWYRMRGFWKNEIHLLLNGCYLLGSEMIAVYVAKLVAGKANSMRRCHPSVMRKSNFKRRKEMPIWKNESYSHWSTHVGFDWNWFENSDVKHLTNDKIRLERSRQKTLFGCIVQLRVNKKKGMRCETVHTSMPSWTLWAKARIFVVRCRRSIICKTTFSTSHIIIETFLQKNKIEN